MHDLIRAEGALNTKASLDRCASRRNFNLAANLPKLYLASAVGLANSDLPVLAFCGV
jgi:hypothetical protein